MTDGYKYQIVDPPNKKAGSVMVERVARVLCARASGIPVDRRAQSWGHREWIDEKWSEYVDLARLAIEAMREPTEAMCDAMPSFHLCRKSEAYQIWKAMIGEALK